MFDAAGTQRFAEYMLNPAPSYAAYGVGLDGNGDVTFLGRSAALGSSSIAGLALPTNSYSIVRLNR